MKRKDDDDEDEKEEEEILNEVFFLISFDFFVAFFRNHSHTFGC